MSITSQDPTQEMTTAQLEELLASRKKKEIKDANAAKKKYEENRDESIAILIASAKQTNEMLSALKGLCHETMDKQHLELSKYNGIRSNSKGGFSVTNSNGNMRVTRRRDTVPNWDERADKGVELIKSFLHTAFKKRDQNLFKILLSFIEKNKDGDLEYAKVLGLIQHRDKFDDERWVKGLQLIEESYSNHLRAYSYELKIKDEQGKWQYIDLSFAGL